MKSGIARTTYTPVAEARSNFAEPGGSVHLATRPDKRSVRA
jgi:hypothetical protein